MSKKKLLFYLKFSRYMTVGCSSVKLVLQKFGHVIKTNIDAPPRIGVDLCGEERLVLIIVH